MKNYEFNILIVDSLFGTYQVDVKERRPRFPASAAKVIQSRCGEQGPKPVTRRLNLTPRQGTDRPTKRTNGLADRCGSRLLERGTRPHS